MDHYEYYDIVDQLSGGAFGKTYLVKLKSTGVLYVMKKVDYLRQEDKARADAEVEQMQRLASPFTVRLICSFQDRIELCMIMEYCEKGDLR
ncbi:MAG: hypothetical protein EZS28_031791, partial [Streblomastix strix]